MQTYILQLGYRHRPWCLSSPCYSYRVRKRGHQHLDGYLHDTAAYAHPVDFEDGDRKEGRFKFHFWAGNSVSLPRIYASTYNYVLTMLLVFA